MGIYIPQTDLSVGVLTVLYKGPCLRPCSFDGCRSSFTHVKMRLESSDVQKPLVKVTKERNFCIKTCKNLYKMTLPSLSGLLEPWLSWLPPGCLLGASWEPPGSLLGAFWESLVPLGSLLGAFWAPPGDIER